MSNIIISIVTVLYLITGGDLAIKGQYGLSLSFVAYAIANVGLLLASRGI